ncbi:MAG: AraC-like DNA-binding protein [Gammaproteobacteria bacterium]|jgi:AraC-like DNA-binding protein
MHAQMIEQLQMPATYGRHLLRLFEPQKLLAGTGLDIATLDDPDCRITVRQALQYIHNTLNLADDPAWYLKWAGTLTDHFHGSTSIALLSAPTLGDGLDAFLRYFPSRIPYMDMQGRYDHDLFRAELFPLIDLGAATPLLVETPMIILQQHLDTVYGVDLSKASLSLSYPPTAYAARYHEYFKCSVSFDAHYNAFSVPAEWRDLKNIGYIESTWAHAVAQCAATMASSRERETLGQVREYLSRAFERDDKRRPLPVLSEVAGALHLSPRTLIRRLRHLGTSYQDVTDDFLRARVRELLTNDCVTVREIAASLGFDNPANFGKMFKRWFGTSPGKFRESIR